MNPNFAASLPQATGADALGAGGARHAALLLHAMAPTDRDWVLASLQPAERDGLQALLRELEELGIERDPSLIAEATAAAAPATPTGHGDRIDDAWLETPVSDEAWLRRLADSQMPLLAASLRGEPPGLVVQFLRLSDWPWRHALLQALDPVQRRRVESAIDEASNAADLPPALRAALVEAVAQRLRQQPAAAAPARERVAGWKQSLSRLLRPGAMARGAQR